MKPMLACDYDESKLVFPVYAQPKIDGVRALNMHGGLTGRSLKLFKNRFTTDFYSRESFRGFDGEMVAEVETHPDLCRLTTSALGTITGEPFTLWWLFDYITEQTQGWNYYDRYRALGDRIQELILDTASKPYSGHLRQVPCQLVETLDDLNKLDECWTDMGFEGTIVRSITGKHKQGRSTVREGGLLRIKRFVESEAIVSAIVEGESNQNEAQVNELGLQFRSSHQANMVPNGLVGSLTCTARDTIRVANRVVISAGQEITVSPGNMDHGMRKYYFDNQNELIGKVIKFKFFPRGIKDKPRFPTFQTIRMAEDL